jgi:N-acetylglucosaminyldiphosphoundecaprenol N-acetyl-beta-D-mannosaminyltransferase
MTNRCGLERKEIISLNISLETYSDAIVKVLALASSRMPSYICFSNVHMVIEAYRNIGFRMRVNNSTFSFADGMPLTFAMKFLYGIRQERIAGMDFMPSVIKECANLNLSIFLFGSSEEVIGALKKRLLSSHPGLRIAGAFSPPFKEFTLADNNSFIEMINGSGANLVFVSLGCPKQETWMADHFHKINAPLLGVGGAFSVHGGYVKRAPRIMQKLGIEWLYRLAQEPKRLFKRYLITNTMFIYLLLNKKMQVTYNYRVVDTK